MREHWRLAGHVELENSRHHDNRLRPVSILEHDKFDGFGAINKQTPTKTMLILCDPIPTTVSADAEQPRLRRCPGRGRFRLNHDTSPSSYDVTPNVRIGAYEFEREGGAL
jgi:hypothetical protein